MTNVDTEYKWMCIAVKNNDRQYFEPFKTKEDAIQFAKSKKNSFSFVKIVLMTIIEVI